MNMSVRSDFSHVGSSASNSEEFRSVIDDLTLENKRLKRRLRKFEKLHCSQLENDKLFEVRIHGLPAYKKKELKETLRGFASSIGGSQRAAPRNQAEQPISLQLGPFPGIGKASSLSTPCPPVIDSAYASMSASGQTSASHQQCAGRSRPRQLTPTADKDKNVISSYLDDNLEGLFPAQSTTMTENLKAKLVVQRLEQLFTGIGACSSQDSHFLQQEKVSRLAAAARTTIDEALGYASSAEGDREARIISSNDQRFSAAAPVWDSEISKDPVSNILNTTPPPNCDQRPTRPSDLDPNRVQVPTSNIDYLRHLGLASPKTSSNWSRGEGEGWIYLNLLINMAQLHIFNVTTEFVRKSVARFSTKFELSQDGQRVRWKARQVGHPISISNGNGNGNGNNSSPESRYGGPSQSSDESVDRISNSSCYSHNKRHLGVLSEFENLDTSQGYKKMSPEFGADSARRPIFLGQFGAGGPLVYKPLFFHGMKSEEEDDYYLNDVRSTVSSVLAQCPTRLGSHDVAGGHDVTRKGEDGPIIFYNGARFCTDLSGDSGVDNSHATDYSKIIQDPIGSRPEAAEDSSIFPRNLSSVTLDGCSVLETEDLPGDILQWPVDSFQTSPSAVTHNVESDEARALFQASGIGGVRPFDHFVVHVKVRRSITDKPAVLQPLQSSRAKPLPSHLLHYVTSDSTSGRCHPLPSTESDLFPIKDEIVFAETKALKPSSLPPPSYACHAVSSSDSDNEDDEVIESDGIYASGPSLSTENVVSALPTSDRRLSCCISRVSSSVASDDLSEDSSMDLLAHARQLDPDSIAAQEREFEDNALQMSAFLEAVKVSTLARSLTDTGYTSSQADSSIQASDSDDQVVRRPNLKRGRSRADYVHKPEKFARLDIVEST